MDPEAINIVRPPGETQPPTQEKNYKPPALSKIPKLRPLIGVLLVIAIVAAVTTTYFLYQTTKLKQQISQLKTQPTPTTKQYSAANWKKYQSDTFEFKYPKAWTLQENPLKLTNSTNTLVISIVSFNSNVVGISYCEASPQDSPRCEKLTTEGTVIIDWGEESSPMANAMFSITDGSGVSVALETNADIPARLILTAQDKEFFRTFLSTFKFLD